MNGDPTAARRIAVIGGGIAGLSAALRLRERLGPQAEITVFEQAGALGGKLRTGELAGSTQELGAETFLAGDPAGGESAAVALARRVGLGDRLVHPAPVPAALVIDRGLTSIPGGHLMGVPDDPDRVATVARVTPGLDPDEGRPLLAEGEDTAIGALTRRRFGDEVVDRLVDPLLGGVYAGRADRLSMEMTVPGLARAARREPTLTAAVRAARGESRRDPAAPVFAGVRGGLSTLVEAVAAASGAALRLGLPVRELRRTGEGWRLVVGPTVAPEIVTADAVVLALPARAAARLLSDVDETAAGTVRSLDYASIALIGLALPAAELPSLSGLLAPAAEGLLIKAATFFGVKWPHLRRDDGVALVRASVGRHGEEHQLQRDDADLVAAAHAELSQLLGPLPQPIDTRVQRWGGALPQYAPGHRARVTAVRERLRAAHPTLVLAGAGYDGVGIPLCVRSGETAAEELIKAMDDKGVA